MKRKSIPVLWMGVAFGVALGIAAAVLTLYGTDPKGLVAALRMTARWAFLLFWMAYIGGAMTTPLARRGREFGLAYAAAMLVHVGLEIGTPKPPRTADPETRNRAPFHKPINGAVVAVQVPQRHRGPS